VIPRPPLVLTGKNLPNNVLSRPNHLCYTTLSQAQREFDSWEACVMLCIQRRIRGCCMFCILLILHRLTEDPDFVWVRWKVQATVMLSQTRRTVCAVNLFCCTVGNVTVSEIWVVQLRLHCRRKTPRSCCQLPRTLYWSHLPPMLTNARGRSPAQSHLPL